MPAKGGELHSEVHPGLGDPRYFIVFVFDYSEEGVRGFVDVVKIEQVFLIIEVRVQPIMNFAGWESTSIEVGWQISTVLHSHGVFLIFLVTTVHFCLVTKFQY